MFAVARSARGYGGATVVDAPTALNVFLGLVKEFRGSFGITAGKDRVPRFLIDIVFERDAGSFGIELERVLALKVQRGVITYQWPIPGEHSGFLLVHAEDHVITVCNAVAISNDQRWAVVCFGFEEGFNGVRVAAAHGHAGNINVAVADRLHCEVFLDRALATHGELRHRTAWSGLGHLSAGVGVHLGVKHEHIDVSAGAEDVIESSKANVVRPAVAANDPHALANKTVRNR